MGGPAVKRPLGKSPRLCISPCCRNDHGFKSPYCPKHQMRNWRAKYPVRAAYGNLKHCAKLRRIAFELTREEFETFCAEHPDFMVKRGNGIGSVNIHRIDHTRGYCAGNITVLDAIENKRLSKWEKAHKHLVKGYVPDPSNCPF